MKQGAALNTERLAFAADIFLAEFRKAEVSMHPDRMPKVKALSDYPPQQQALLLAAIKKAVVSASSAADQNFTRWKEAKSSDK